MNLCQSVSGPDITATDGLPVVVYIHAGGHAYHSYLAVHLVIDHFLQRYQTGNISGYPQANLIADSQNRVITSLCSIALVPSVMSLFRSGSMFIDTHEGFLAGPTVKKRGALNAGLRTCPYRLSG